MKWLSTYNHQHDRNSNYYHLWNGTALTTDSMVWTQTTTIWGKAQHLQPIAWCELKLPPSVKRHSTYSHQHDANSNYHHLWNGPALTTTSMIGTQTTIICGMAQHLQPSAWCELKLPPSEERLSTYNHQHGANSNYHHLWKCTALIVTSMMRTQTTIICEMAQHLQRPTW